MSQVHRAVTLLTAQNGDEITRQALSSMVSVPSDEEQAELHPVAPARTPLMTAHIVLIPNPLRSVTSTVSGIGKGIPKARGMAMDKTDSSKYLEAEKRISTDESYIGDLQKLKELVYEGNFRREKSPEAERDTERRDEFVRLASIYEEAHMAFGEERRQMLLKSCEHSPYLERMVGSLPDTYENREHLKNLRRLRSRIFHMEVGYGCQGLGMMLHSLKTKYPEEHDIFLEEIREQMASLR